MIYLCCAEKKIDPPNEPITHAIKSRRFCQVNFTENDKIRLHFAFPYGVDIFNVLFLTPLPGTVLWNRMEEEGRIVANRFPEDWKYFTLTLPVGRYKQLTQDEILNERNSCIHRFYSLRGILRRVVSNLWKRQHPFLALVTNLPYCKNGSISRGVCQEFKRSLCWTHQFNSSGSR